MGFIINGLGYELLVNFLINFGNNQQYKVGQMLQYGGGFTRRAWLVVAGCWVPFQLREITPSRGSEVGMCYHRLTVALTDEHAFIEK